MCVCVCCYCITIILQTFRRITTIDTKYEIFYCSNVRWANYVYIVCFCLRSIWHTNGVQRALPILFAKRWPVATHLARCAELVNQISCDERRYAFRNSGEPFESLLLLTTSRETSDYISIGIITIHQHNTGYTMRFLILCNFPPFSRAHRPFVKRKSFNVNEALMSSPVCSPSERQIKMKKLSLCWTEKK